MWRVGTIAPTIVDSLGPCGAIWPYAAGAAFAIGWRRANHINYFMMGSHESANGEKWLTFVWHMWSRSIVKTRKTKKAESSPTWLPHTMHYGEATKVIPKLLLYHLLPRTGRLDIVFCQLPFGCRSIKKEARKQKFLVFSLPTFGNLLPAVCCDKKFFFSP